MKRNLIALLFLFHAIFPMEQEEQQQQPSGPTISIMTWNIRRDGPEEEGNRKWNNRKALIFAAIKKANPTILALQEATQGQLNDIQKAFPQFRITGTSRGSSWLGYGADEFTPILYNSTVGQESADTFSINQSRYPLWTPLELHKTGWLSRICTRALFSIGNRRFYLYNTHLDNNFESARKEGLAVIKAKMHPDSGSQEMLPIIFVGDFNQDYDETAAVVGTAFQHGSDQATYRYGNPETKIGWNDDERKRIDHILINSNDCFGIQVERYETLENEWDAHPSDHLPVIMDIRFE